MENSREPLIGTDHSSVCHLPRNTENSSDWINIAAVLLILFGSDYMHLARRTSDVTIFSNSNPGAVFDHPQHSRPGQVHWAQFPIEIVRGVRKFGMSLKFV